VARRMRTGMVLINVQTSTWPRPSGDTTVGTDVKGSFRTGGLPRGEKPVLGYGSAFEAFLVCERPSMTISGARWITEYPLR
jgi:hypothetical protein